MSDIVKAENTLNNILKSLISDSGGLDENLSDLSHLLSKTLQNESILDELSKSLRIWRLIKIILQQEIVENDNLTVQVRLVRGVVLLGRNMLSLNRDIAIKLDLQRTVLKCLRDLNALSISSELSDNIYVSTFQFLANLTVNKKDHSTELIGELVDVFKTKSSWDETVLFPIVSFLNNLFDSSDVLYEALSKGRGKEIFDILLAEFEKLDITSELSPYQLIIIKIFSKLIIHESYLKFITVHNEEEYTVKYLTVAQIIITSKSSWEVFELTVILSWTFELFQKLVLRVQDYFAQKPTESPKYLYEEVSRILDIFAVLSHFDHARKFFLSYEALETLVSLLGILHKNIKPKKLKDSDRQKKISDTELEYENFPHTKSLIIETLSSLVYKNFEVQEKLREIHGLELVLSNCIIDDNEPFIKERSIVCLRFLLLDNQGNQDFVAQLEAKEVIPSETLDEVGFEVEIIDGKVKMKPKPKIKELE